MPEYSGLVHGVIMVAESLTLFVIVEFRRATTFLQRDTLLIKIMIQLKCAYMCTGRSPCCSSGPVLQIDSMAVVVAAGQYGDACI